MEPFDRSLAADAVISAYALLGLQEPEIVFCDRPTIIAWKMILKILAGEELWNRVEWLLENEDIETDDNIIEKLGNKIANQLNSKNIRQKLGGRLEGRLKEELIDKQTEKAEVRRAIVRAIGYARLCQKLQAVELDSWREYALLEIKSGRDLEEIYLLKMTCPSTRDIHVLRVTPSMRQAREAIKWINWGIDPEEFIAVLK